MIVFVCIYLRVTYKLDIKKRFVSKVIFSNKFIHLNNCKMVIQISQEGIASIVLHSETL